MSLTSVVCATIKLSSTNLRTEVRHGNPRLDLCVQLELFRFFKVTVTVIKIHVCVIDES